MPSPHYLRHVFCAGLAVHGQPLLLAPRHERLNLDVHLFDFLSLALEHPHSVNSTAFPLFVRSVELVSVFNDFGQALPLLSVKPRQANNYGAIGRLLGHDRVCRNLTFAIRAATAQHSDAGKRFPYGSRCEAPGGSDTCLRTLSMTKSVSK